MYKFSNVSLLFSGPVLSNSLRPCGLQHKLPCPSQSLLKLMPTESMMPSSHLILCHPLLFLPLVFPRIRVFSNESALCIRWPKYWSFRFSPSNECSELISFKISWFDLLAVQETHKSLLQHHSSKVSIFWPSAFFLVQLLHLYMTTRKTIALAIWTFCPPLNYKAEGALKMCGQGGRLAVDLVVKWLLSPSSG